MFDYSIPHPMWLHLIYISGHIRIVVYHIWIPVWGRQGHHYFNRGNMEKHSTFYLLIIFSCYICCCFCCCLDVFCWYKLLYVPIWKEMGDVNLISIQCQQNLLIRKPAWIKEIYNMKIMLGVSYVLQSISILRLSYICYLHC